MCKITYERETIFKNLLPSENKRGARRVRPLDPRLILSVFLSGVRICIRTFRRLLRIRTPDQIRLGAGTDQYLYNVYVVADNNVTVAGRALHYNFTLSLATGFCYLHVCNKTKIKELYKTCRIFAADQGLLDITQIAKQKPVANDSVPPTCLLQFFWQFYCSCAGRLKLSCNRRTSSNLDGNRQCGRSTNARQ